MRYALHISLVVDGMELEEPADVVEKLIQLRMELGEGLARYRAWGEEKYGQKWAAEWVSGTLVPSLQGGGD